MAEVALAQEPGALESLGRRRDDRATTWLCGGRRRGALQEGAKIVRVKPQSSVFVSTTADWAFGWGRSGAQKADMIMNVGATSLCTQAAPPAEGGGRGNVASSLDCDFLEWVDYRSVLTGSSTPPPPFVTTCDDFRDCVLGAFFRGE